MTTTLLTELQTWARSRCPPLLGCAYRPSRRSHGLVA